MFDENISLEFVWSDSLGAKSMCTFVETPEVNVLLDPGVAVMQPSFPASPEEKSRWKENAWRSIKKAGEKADVIVVSHYHYDHFTDFDEDLYDGKLLLLKNPNEFINDSQMERARSFIREICESFGGVDLHDLMQERPEREYGNPMSDIPHARDMDFGDYNSRRQELLEKWLDNYWDRVKNWNSSRWIPEFELDDVEVRFPEGSEFEFGRTRLRFVGPLFHGIELSKTGWVFSTIIEREGEKFLYSSDLQGPTVEDYSDWIIGEGPDVLYLDGPATYLLGYMLNKTNLNRAVENAARIVENLDSELILYDHHLVREKKFRERTEKVWRTADREDMKLRTVAEFKGDEPVVLP